MTSGANFKGAGISFVRETLRAHGASTESRFLASLSEEEASVYASALPINWIALETASSLYDKAAKLLYPSASEPVAELGRVMAHNDMNGMYRILLRVVTVPMVIKKAASVWRNFHKVGDASVPDSSSTHGDFVIANYEALPRAMRLNTSGYIRGLLELTGVKDIRVSLDESNPAAWHWRVEWS